MFGDFMTFDITYNLIKEFKLSQEETRLHKKKWGLGLIMGKNCNNRPIPFAVIATNC